MRPSGHEPRSFRERRLGPGDGRGFTYVEVVLSISLLVVVMGAFVVALNGGMSSFATGCASGVLSERTQAALRKIEADLREAPAGDVDVCVSGLPAGQAAFLLPSARDSAGVFHVTSAPYEPEWQAVVVYCPYVTDAGVSQLRRYVYYRDASDFPFHFHGAQPITDEYIELKGHGSASITVDREEGNTSLPAGLEFQVFCPGLTDLVVTPGAPTTVTLRARCLTRGETELAEERASYVAHRNP